MTADPTIKTGDFRVACEGSPEVNEDDNAGAQSASPGNNANSPAVQFQPSGSHCAPPAPPQEEKGRATRQRRWEQRREKQQLAEEQARVREEAKRKQDEAFMREALRQARKAAAAGDVPIGCVLVSGGRIIARGYNRRNADKSVLSHAEVSAIRKACKKMGDWRLEDCVLYVTLEPCPMCAGAIVQARIPRVVIGCSNPKAGCAGSVLDMLHQPGFNHQAETEIGILEEDCSRLMKEFFQNLRRRKAAGEDEPPENLSSS